MAVHRTLSHVGLTFVPTPLGNLRDITLRALDVLREADLIVAEDTRVTRRLLSAHGITGKRLWSYREANAAAVTAPILERAARERIAVVSDAGTPAISDPGRDLIRAAREAAIPVEVLPGPVAFICAAVLSGFDLGVLRFEGFVPRASAHRRETLRAALERVGTSAFYESPQRIVATLGVIEALDPGARIFLARELTKLHEQQILGTARNVLDALAQPVQGEIVLVLAGAANAQPMRDEHAVPADVDAAIDKALEAGVPVPAIARDLAQRGMGSRSELYARASARKRV